MSSHGPGSISFVLDGQGIPSATSSQTVQTALHDAQSPLARSIILACHQALLRDLGSLSSTEYLETGLVNYDLADPVSLLELPLHHPSNAIVGNIHLYLIQILRYLAHTSSADMSITDTTLQGSDVLGFSSGILAATVIACGRDIPSFISHAVAAFRVAFWLGFRAQQHAHKAETDVALGERSWSLVTFGSTRAEVQQAIDRFMAQNPTMPPVYLSAVTHETCISLSGRPDALEAFRSDHLPSSTTTSRHSPIHALYHSPELLQVKLSVLSDLDSRKITFPTYTDLTRNLRSSVTGEIIPRVDRDDGCMLAEEVIDMILLHPVNFDRVTTAINRSCPPSGMSCTLANIGPGTALWKSIARHCPQISFSMVDWSASARTEPSIPLSPQTPSIKHRAPPREPIAIVGMAAQFPQADDTAALWKILEEGINTVSEIPASRFKVSDYNNSAHGPGRSMKAKFGNFLNDPAMFDNAFFRISPREARSMDPQQRMLLQVSYHALENAGFVPGATQSFDPDTFAVYVGVATNDYTLNLSKDIDVYYSTGTLQAFLSGKISYAFGFSGPSVVVDTACSSSMVAIYQACRALNNRDCNAALAGGVNVMTSPDMYIGLDRAHFLSSTGQCKPWDASADGYSRSEGCGIFVLKRLSDALAENDNILGVIRGIEVNQSANADSITQPHIPTQINLFKKLVSSTGIEPSSVSVAEAHGTGTKAGDPTEIQSIRAIFAQNRSSANPLHLTSIKANIGHAEAASGAASLTKLLLMLRHRTIPSVISLKQLNPKIQDLQSDHTCIDTETVPWNAPTSGDGLRLALLNNFGAAGSNAALLLQESPPLPRLTGHDHPAFILGLSCDSEEALEERRNAYLQLLRDDAFDSGVAVADLTYTATARRQLHQYRLAVSGKSSEELHAELERARPVRANKSHHKLVFVFSGQGGQYLGMGSQLYRSLPEFRRIVDSCQTKLISWGYGDILQVIDPKEGEDVGENVVLYQCAVFALECALASVWSSWGLKPDAVAGHSLGEYAALVTAEVLELADALKLVAGRAKLMTEKCVPLKTGMLAVKLSSRHLQQYIVEYPALSIACYNSCEDVVVAGDLDELTKLQAALKASNHKCARVNVPFAYHTEAMSPILADLTTLASGVKLSAPSIPVVSNARGTVVRPGDSSIFNAEYFARHCGEPVKFEQGIHDLRTGPDSDSPCIFVEIGPHPTTLSMLRSSSQLGHTDLYLPSLKKNAVDWEILSRSLAELYCNSDALNWRKVFADSAPDARVTDLPAYPFAKKRVWVEYTEAKHTPKHDISPPTLPTRFTLLASCIFLPSPAGSEPAIFETPIDRLAGLIEGHKVAEFALCPASVYIEMATAAAQLLLEHVGSWDPAHSLSISEITFSNPLVYAKEVTRTVRISLSLTGTAEKQTANFNVSSYLTDPSDAQNHCCGTVTVSSTSSVANKLSLSGTTVDRRRLAVLGGSGSNRAETFHTRVLYDVVFSRIVSYSQTYRSIKSITLDSNGVDAFAVMQLPKDTVSGHFTVHPVFTDTLLHAAGFVINCTAGQNEAFICSQIDKVKVLAGSIKPDAQYGIYCNIGFMSETLAIADAYAFELNCPDVTIVAHIKRMRFRKLRLSGFKSVLSLAGASHPKPQTRNVHASSGSPSPTSTLVSAKSTAHAKQRPTALPRLETYPDMKRVKDVMAEVLGMQAQDLSEDQDLERLGLDSLTSIEAQHAICAAFKITLPDNLFATCKTMRHICVAVSSLSHSAELPLTPVTSRSDAGMHEQDVLSNSNSVQPTSLDQLRDILASVLGIPAQDLAADHDLERLGMDSLMSIEAHHAISSTLDVILPDNIFASSKTVRSLQLSIDSMRHVSGPSSGPLGKNSTFGTDVNPVRLQLDENSKAPPLFLIHDGSGIAHCYSRLSPLGRTVWGIHNPKFPTGEKWEGGLVAMADHYATLIKSKLSSGEGCVVGGWSVGGVIAFEVARRLMASGVPVGGLVLIDSPDPYTSTPLSDEVIAAMFADQPRSRAVELARSQMQHCTRSLVEYDPSASSAKDFLPAKAVMLRSREAFHVAHSISASDRFLNARDDPTIMLAGWERALGNEIQTLSIPGNHFQPFDPPFVGEVSLRLKEALSLLSGQ